MDIASNLVFELVFIRALSLNPFLFIIVLEALSRQFRTFVHGSCSMQMISAESMSIEELLVKLKTLKSDMAKKG